MKKITTVLLTCFLVFSGNNNETGIEKRVYVGYISPRFAGQEKEINELTEIQYSVMDSGIIL